MNVVLLVLWFVNADTGELEKLDGWGDRVQPSMAVCEERRDAIASYMAQYDVFVSCERVYN